jgi:NADPH:quinone reductase-like Zn-dependent oxidoreductase
MTAQTTTPPVAARPATRGMRAIVQRAYGTADTLSLAEVDRPSAGAGDVLVEVRAAGLDRGTWHFMAGEPYAIRLVSGLRAPKQPVLGRDLAGVVVEVGDGVTRFRAGDEVFGIGGGAFAEYALAPEAKLLPKPANLSFEQAAALPISGLTALRGLVDVGGVQAGQQVLVVGASGGVGTYAVQIAKAHGAVVTGVASTAKLDLVRSLGADAVVDYTREDFTATGPYDLVMDIGGSSPLRALRRALTPSGTLVITGGEDAGRWLGVSRQLHARVASPFTRQRLTAFLAKEDLEGLRRLAGLVADGRVVPAIDRTYPLAEMPDAMRRLVSGNARGKLVISV